jgi:RimJ/RimL family protein N-acetyltransferase
MLCDPEEAPMLAHPLGDGAELRPLEPWQAAEFAAYVEEQREHLRPWLPWAVFVTDEPSARAFLQRYADRQAADEGRIYGLWEHDRLVGGTLFRVFDAAGGTCEIGVWLSADAVGRGLVTRAASAMVDWAVSVRGMRRVEWHTVPENRSSRAVAERLGMQLEGVQRQAFEHEGRLWDVELWALVSP